jgi:DNA-binding protein YbaB
LFKPKNDKNGKVIITDNVVEIETDKDGMQVINDSAINDALTKAKFDLEQFN